MNIVYSKAEVEAAVNFAKQDPEGFIRATKRFATSVTAEEVKKSLKAWEIPFDEEADAYNPSNRTSRNRQNYRDY